MYYLIKNDSIIEQSEIKADLELVLENGMLISESWPPIGLKFENGEWKEKSISEKVLDSEISVETRISQLKNEILIFAEATLNQGVVFLGSVFQARKEDKDNLSDTILLINLEVPWGNKWRNLENNWIPISNEELIELAKLVGQYNISVFYISRFLIDELPSLSLEELANYNIEDRWNNVSLPEDP